MGQQDVEKLLSRSKAAWQVKDQWKGVLSECYDYALPSLNPYAADKKNPRMMNRQFDSTAPNAAHKLANRILNELTPLHEEWVSLELGPVLEMQLSEAEQEQLRGELDKVSKIVNMVVNQGDAVAARHSAYMELVVAGMGCVLNLEDPYHPVNPVSSEAVTQAEVALEKNARNENILISRKRKMKLSQVKETWPDAEIPKSLSTKSSKNNDPEIDVVEITYKNPDPKTRGRNEPDWYYDVIYAEGDKGDRLVERNYNENPWTILQWLVLPGCPYGPGPVLFALADIRVANKIVMMILQNAALALSGMYLARDDGVINPDNIQITQGGIVPVKATGGPLGASLVPLETGRNFDVGQILLDEYQMRIKKWLYDHAPPAKSGNPLSATEFIERMRELTQDLGAGIGRLSGDHVDYVRRIVGISVRAGIIPFNINIDQFTLRVQINSPLARAQQLQKVETVVRWLQTCMELGGEEAAAIVAKMQKILIWIGMQMGVPMELMNSAIERQQKEQDIATVATAGVMPGTPPAALTGQA